jgi:pentatricopeptide repeat protein
MMHEAFKKMHEHDVVSWNAMIVGYAQHGKGKDALQLFKKMQEAGVLTKPHHLCRDFGCM